MKKIIPFITLGAISFIGLTIIICIALLSSCTTNSYNSYNSLEQREEIANKAAEKLQDSLSIEILKHQIDSIKTKYCKVTTDKYTGRTFISSKNEPYYTNSRNYVGIYLSLDSNTYNSDGTLFLRVDYVGSDWIFWDRAYFLFDNDERTDIGIESYDKDTDVYMGGVCEVGDMVLGSLYRMDSDYYKNRLDIAKMCMNTKSISVKLVGEYSKVISCKVNDFKPICDIYFMMYQIRTIEKKYSTD